MEIRLSLLLEQWTEMEFTSLNIYNMLVVQIKIYLFTSFVLYGVSC